jgi:hypothetical protein
VLVARLIPRLRHVDPSVGLANPGEDHLHFVDVSGVQISKQREHVAISSPGAKARFQ